MKTSPLAPLALLALIFHVPARAADFSWDGEPGVTVAGTTTQFGPATGSVWTSSAAGPLNWIAGNTVTGTPNIAWVNATDSFAQFKSGSNSSGTAPASVTLSLGENITAGKIDVGGSFVALTLANSAGNTFGLTFGGVAQLATNGPLLTVDVVISGSAGLNKINGGQAVLNRANNYTGNTTVSAGILTALNAASYSAGTVLVNTTGQAWVNGTAGALSVANNFDLNAGNTAGAIRLTNATLTGNIALTGNSTITATTAAATPAPSTGTLSGAITETGGARALTFVQGTINLTGTASNTYTGLTTLTAGTLNLNKTGPATAISGNLQVNGGLVAWLATNQVADTSDITVASGASMTTGNRADTVRNVTINSATTSTISGLNITDTLTISAGIQDGANSGGTLTTNRAVLGGASTLQLGANSGASTWNIGAGGLSLNGATVKLGNAGGAFAALVNLSGDVTATGTNAFTAPNVAGLRSLNLQGANRNFAVNGGVTTVEATVTVDNGGLTKSGAGALVLAAGNSYEGGTVVNGGVLLANNGVTGSATGPGTVSINTAGTLAGNGRVAGATTASGKLSPGADALLTTNGLGTLAFDNNLALGSGSSLTLQFDAPSANNPAAAANPALITSNPGKGAQQDFLTVGGNFDLNAGTVFQLDLGSYVLQPGDILDLFDFASGSLRLNGFNPATQITVAGNTNGLTLDNSRFSSFGVLVAVPEPGAAGLGAVALAALLGRRRRSS